MDKNEPTAKLNFGSRKTEKQNNNSNSLSEKTTSIQFSVLRNSMTKIGLGVCVILLIVTGILIGLFGRFYYEPHKTLVRLDGFSIALPFDPSVEEVTGMPPFSNRKLIKYQVVVSPKTEYQILVMQPNGLADKPVEETLDLKTADADTDLEQWAQSTIGVLCADEQSRAIKKDCLQKGSRLTKWSLITPDGRRVQGSLSRAKNGRIVQLLATGTTDEDALEFFESYRSE